MIKVKYRLFSILLVFLLVFGIAGGKNSCAQADDTASTAHAFLRVIPSVTQVSAGDAFWVGLQMEMEPGWHVYWRNPGDSGFSVNLTWLLPEGFKAGEMIWPLPDRIEEEGLVTYGYPDQADFLTQIFVAENISNDEPVRVKLLVKFLACKEICVPGSADLEITFPLDEQQEILTDQDIASFFNTVPLTDAPWQIQVQQDADALIFTGRPQGNKIESIKRIVFFPYEPEIIDNAADQDLVWDKEVFHLRVPFSPLFDGELADISGVLVADQPWRSDGIWHGLEIDSPVFLGELDTAEVTPTIHLLGAILFAFLGGIILNLMPCVLPVLSIKVLSLVGQAGEKKADVLRHGLAFAFGIVAAFWALAGLLIIFRFFGASVGWGFQFQSPVFLVLMIYLFLFIALNLFGLFEIGQSFTRVSVVKVTTARLTGSFLNGVLATVVATPCTAPFMGAALGYALSQSLGVAFLVFTALGVGMALPYLLLSMNPKWLARVPRPGPWMVSMKQFFGFVLLGTVGWLIWVLGIQRGVESVSAVLFGLVLFAFGIWLMGRGTQIKAKIIWRGFGILCVLTAVFFGILQTRQDLPLKVDKLAGQKGVWQRYSPSLLENLRRQNVPVFVDFTASWCLTCQVNKATTLNRSEVIAAFDAKGVHLLKADWTNYDPMITRALEDLGKSSIPVYLLYLPSSADPLVLPELLTPQIVGEYLQRI